MTIARRELPGQTYMVTRRCLERRYFLRPTPAVKEVFLYALCLAASRHGITLVAVVVESSHWHAVLVDPEQKLSDFMHDVDQNVARALNAYYGRGGNLWGAEEFSSVELHGAETVLEKIVYLLSGVVLCGALEGVREQRVPRSRWRDEDAVEPDPLWEPVRVADLDPVAVPLHMDRSLPPVVAGSPGAGSAAQN